MAHQLAFNLINQLTAKLLVEQISRVSEYQVVIPVALQVVGELGHFDAIDVLNLAEDGRERQYRPE